MASFVFDQVKGMVARGELNFNVGNGIYRLALVNNVIFDDPEQFSDKLKWSDISTYEIDPNLNPGYQKRPLNTMTITPVDVNGFTQNIISADDVVYNVSTITTSGFVIFRADTGGTVNPDGPLIAAVDVRRDFGSGLAPIQSVDGVFTISLSFDSGGFLTIK